MEKNVGQCLKVFQFFSVVYSVTLDDIHFLYWHSHHSIVS